MIKGINQLDLPSGRAYLLQAGIPRRSQKKQNHVQLPPLQQQS